MPIKVLEIVNSLSTGGAELMVKRMAFGFDPELVRADVLAICRDSADAEAIYREGFEERGLRCESLGKTPGRKDPVQLLQLASRIRKGGYDIVHAHCGSPSIYGRLAALLVPGTKRMVTIHLRMSAQAVRLERLFAPITDRFIACSSETELNLRDDCRLPESKFSRILNGTAGDRTAGVTRSRDEIRERHGIAPHEQVALVLARLDPQKAHLELMKALVQPGEHVARLKLWCVGNDRTDYGELVRQSIAQKGLDSRVQMLGRVEDHEVDELMKGADLFLLPSHFEGMSVAILEALAAGMPTVISDLETNREATDDGRVGWLTPVDDPAALAVALDSVLASPQQMQARGKQAAAFAHEKFSFERVVQEYTEAYAALVR